MSENTTEVIVGAGVLAAAVAFVIYAGQISDFSSASATYPLSASFRSLEGVNVGSDVRLAGVKIGTVADVTLNPETYRADTVVSLNQGIEIPDDSAIVISSEGLLGGNFVEIVPGGSPFFYEAGDTIDDTQGAVSLVTLLMKFVGGDSE
jgi:phospholipid/cholesterol/gamma-HCH transport system substrate-binding protein